MEKHYDLAVIGGGFSGCAAALAAARGGAKHGKKRRSIGAHLRRGKAHHHDPQHRGTQHSKPFLRKEQRTAQHRSTHLRCAQHSSAQHRSQGEYPARGESSAA